MSQDILKEDIKNNSIRSLYLFSGPEDYLIRFYMDSIISKLLPEGLREMNLVRLEGKQELGKLADYCETLPAFSEKKVVVVRDSGFFKTKKKAADPDKKKQQSDGLAEFLQDVPDHTCLIFIESELDKRLKQYIDIIKKKGLLVEFDYLKPEEMVRWAARRFKAEGKEIDQNTVSQLVEECEQGMTVVLNEINKVIAYLGERTRVTSEDLDKVCVKSVKGRIFDLTDAIAAKNSSRALSLLNDMIVLKEPVPKILFMISRQLRQLLQVKLMKSEGAGPDEIARKLGLLPFIAGKLVKQSQGFSLEKLKKTVETSLELDLAVKTGRLGDRMAVELLIVELSSQ